MRSSFTSIAALVSLAVSFTLTGVSAAVVPASNATIEAPVTNSTVTAAVPGSTVVATITSSIAAASVSSSVTAVPVSTDTQCAPVPPKTGQICDPSAQGSKLEQRQRIAIRDFTRLLWREGKVQEAFDLYVPGEFIQHNPGALSGRDLAIPFLINLWKTPSLTATNITEWAGEGIGSIHYQLKAPAVGIDVAIAGIFRFEGTCIVEHWDVTQTIFGNETNPIAFF